MKILIFLGFMRIFMVSALKSFKSQMSTICTETLIFNTVLKTLCKMLKTSLKF